MTQLRHSRAVIAMAFIVLAAGGASCGLNRANGPSPAAGSPRAVPAPSLTPLPTATLRVFSDRGAVTVRVEIAETPYARGQGLMERRHLAPNAGMVFLFDQPTTNRFWMKNTLIPLSIAFWDEEGRIVSILDMVPCREDRCPLYSAGTSYIGAVEVNRGFFKAHGVEVGDRVELER